MTYTEIACEKRGAVTVIPEARNCIGPTTHRELVEAWTRFRYDDEAKVDSRAGMGTQVLARNPAPFYVHSQQTLESIVEAARTTQLRL